LQFNKNSKKVKFGQVVLNPRLRPFY